MNDESSFKTGKIKIFPILLIFLLASCSFWPQKTEQPPIEFDSAYLNKQINLIVVEDWNDFRVTSPVSFFMVLNSDAVNDEVVFRNDFDARIFYKQGERWIEVSQNPVIRPPDNVSLSAETKTSRIVTLFPEFPDRAKKYEVRVYVFGEIITSDGPQRVGAFADIKLAP